MFRQKHTKILTLYPAFGKALLFFTLYPRYIEMPSEFTKADFNDGASKLVGVLSYSGNSVSQMRQWFRGNITGKRTLPVERLEELLMAWIGNFPGLKTIADIRFFLQLGEPEYIEIIQSPRIQSFLAEKKLPDGPLSYFWHKPSGIIPPLPRTFIPRPEILEQARPFLDGPIEQPLFIILSGPPASGKTLLMSVIAHQERLRGEKYWVQGNSDGNLQDWLFALNYQVLNINLPALQTSVPLLSALGKGMQHQPCSIFLDDCAVVDDLVRTLFGCLHPRSIVFITTRQPIASITVRENVLTLQIKRFYDAQFQKLLEQSIPNATIEQHQVWCSITEQVDFNILAAQILLQTATACEVDFATISQQLDAGLPFQASILSEQCMPAVYGACQIAINYLTEEQRIQLLQCGVLDTLAYYDAGVFAALWQVVPEQAAKIASDIAHLTGMLDERRSGKWYIHESVLAFLKASSDQLLLGQHQAARCWLKRYSKSPEIAGLYKQYFRQSPRFSTNDLRKALQTIRNNYEPFGKRILRVFFDFSYHGPEWPVFQQFAKNFSPRAYVCSYRIHAEERFYFFLLRLSLWGVIAISVGYTLVDSVYASLALGITVSLLMLVVLLLAFLAFLYVLMKAKRNNEVYFALWRSNVGEQTKTDNEAN